MALNIEGASIGFDSNNVEKALRNLNTNVVIDTGDIMKNKLWDLYKAVDSAWVGASAEQFKENMSKDVETIRASLMQTYDVLESEMHQIINEMAAADEELVKGRDA